MYYYIEILGPTLTVPITVNATVSALGAYSSAVLQIGSNQGIALSLAANTNGTNGQPYSADTLGQLGPTVEVSYVPGTPVTNNLTWTANSNTVYQVSLSAGADTAGQPGTSASAYVDPTFSIASSVSDPQDYSILLSDGIGDSPASNTAAPEPTTVALVFSGIGAVACFRRRKS